MKPAISFALILLGASPLCADVTLNSLFSDHMVLQRGEPVPVWGRADPGERITVSFRQAIVETVADPQGRWRLELPAMKVAAATDLIVTGRNTIKLRDVVVGEVWICGGQSNMAWLVSRSLNAEQEIAAARHPDIRHFRVKQSHSSSPVDEAPTVKAWEVCSPATVGAFTGVGYYFSRALHRELGVPVGIINASYGGTAVEAWTRREALERDPAAPAVHERWKQLLAAYPAKKAKYDRDLVEWKTTAAQARAAGEKAPPAPRAPIGPGDRNMPGMLYNAMIHPLLPFAFRGVIWYQGEANAARPDEYLTLFPTLIKQWRQDFGREDFPFYFAQLANFATTQPANQNYAFQREAQTAALALPRTGMVVTLDVGEPDNIHPANKQAVGERFARLALAQVFGHKIETSGPVADGFRIEGNRVRIRFQRADGLELRPGTAFEVAGEDRVFVAAEAKLEGKTVVVSAPAVSKPIAVRYAWANAPASILYNSAGLPAAPFRSDNWPRR